VPSTEEGFKNRTNLLECLVSNDEDRCANNEACKWEGEKTMCHDTAGWKTKNGLRCSTFAEKFCVDGDIPTRLLKYASSIYNNPADNCCECGKRIAEENTRPAVPVNPNTIYNKCTTRDEDKDNYRMIEYCSSIGSDYISCNSDNGEYCQQKCGKSHEKL